MLQKKQRKILDPADGEKNREVNVNWLDLPDHLLFLIADKLNQIKDYIRLGAVCPPWRSSFYTHNLQWFRAYLPRHLPLLMLSPPNDFSNRCFYIIPEKIFYTFPLPLLHNKNCHGCSKGWLVTACENSVVHLLNPFLSVDNQIKLPPLTTLGLYPNDFSKAVISTNPASNPDYVVMAIYGDLRMLAFIKPGNSVWTSLGLNYKWFEDVIYYNHQFYAVNTFGDVFTCDVNPPHPMVSRIAAPSPESGHMKYLLESNGDLLLIVRIREYTSITSFTARFKIFKLNTIKLKWIEIKSLSGGMIFLCENSSMSILASDLPGCKPNSIYFVGNKCKGYDIGVFNIEDGSVEPHYRIVSNTTLPAPVWIMPTM